MRGKHANAARNRRERVELEQRAERAERRAERLEKELAALKEASERRIGSLQQEVKDIAAERDQHLSPTFKQVHEHMHRAQKERDSLKSRLQALSQHWRRVHRNIVPLLQKAEFTHDQIEAVLRALSDLTQMEVFDARVQGQRIRRTSSPVTPERKP